MAYSVFVVQEFSPESLPELSYIPKARNVCLGGSFDRIHKGHLLLLATAVACVQKGGTILVGIVDGPLLSRKLYGNMVREYQHRRRDVWSILTSFISLRTDLLDKASADEEGVATPQSEAQQESCADCGSESSRDSHTAKTPQTPRTPPGPGCYGLHYAAEYSGIMARTIPLGYRSNVTLKLFRIHDPYGPSVTSALDEGVLVVSTETILGGHMVNVERIKRGLGPVSLAVVPLLRDWDGEKVSSTRIREEESMSDSFIERTN